MNTYSVTYKLDTDLEHIAKVEAPNAGEAFARCQKKHPTSTMLKVEREGDRKFGGYTKYEPPPIQREPAVDPKPPRMLKPNEKGCEMSFYDSCISRKP